MWFGLLLCAGKWAYEVLISSQGLMQIGWCTLNCRFNQEVNAHAHDDLSVILQPHPNLTHQNYPPALNLTQT